MGDSGPELVYPSAAQICEVNRRMVKTFGGHFKPPDNLQNEAALHYILAAISSTLMGRDLYVSPKEKAAELAYHIITRHVFLTGTSELRFTFAGSFFAAIRCL